MFHRAPGIGVYVFHGATKRERERLLEKVQRRGWGANGQLWTGHDVLGAAQPPPWGWLCLGELWNILYIFVLFFFCLFIYESHHSQNIN